VVVSGTTIAGSAAGGVRDGHGAPISHAQPAISLSRKFRCVLAAAVLLLLSCFLSTPSLRLATALPARTLGRILLEGPSSGQVVGFGLQSLPLLDSENVNCDQPRPEKPLARLATEFSQFSRRLARGSSDPKPTAARAARIPDRQRGRENRGRIGATTSRYCSYITICSSTGQGQGRKDCGGNERRGIFRARRRGRESPPFFGVPSAIGTAVGGAVTPGTRSGSLRRKKKGPRVAGAAHSQGQYARGGPASAPAPSDPRLELLRILPIRDGGHTTASATPTSRLLVTGPSCRLSRLFDALSPGSIVAGDAREGGRPREHKSQVRLRVGAGENASSRGN
jgi:hypothetical protein